MTKTDAERIYTAIRQRLAAIDGALTYSALHARVCETVGAVIPRQIMSGALNAIEGAGGITHSRTNNRDAYTLVRNPAISMQGAAIRAIKKLPYTLPAAAPVPAETADDRPTHVAQTREWMRELILNAITPRPLTLSEIISSLYQSPENLTPAERGRISDILSDLHKKHMVTRTDETPGRWQRVERMPVRTAIDVLKRYQPECRPDVSMAVESVLAELRERAA